MGIYVRRTEGKERERGRQGEGEGERTVSTERTKEDGKTERKGRARA